ncbi:GGDEF domain-containing protein [Fervidobacterium thailandense]|uniref:GGDEF domain-containing protein n=1 Tax=Fervidobacterium thailandense TaxID=1008305 RepID=A0A1E3G3C9_9BACT|nr:GGDEF domain-containing protein [Fervidobacterium thailandense]ODN30709.1 hypothetical protein A4H02_04025 [Fervidobacterium thailandense]
MTFTTEKEKGRITTKERGSGLFGNLAWGGEEFQKSRNDDVLVRKISKHVAGDFDKFVKYQNSFTWLDFFAVPAEVREIEDFYYVTYLGALGDRVSLDKLSMPQRQKLIERLTELAWAIRNGFVPTIPYFSFDDVFEFAGDFTFIPPVPLSSTRLADLSSSNDSIFVLSEEHTLGQSNVESSLRLLENVVERIDTDGTYLDTFRKTVFGDKYYTLHVASLEYIDEVVRNLKKELQGLKGFQVVQLEGVDITFLDALSRHLVPEVMDEWFVVPIKSDFMNILRHLVRYADALNVPVEESLFRCLYENCRFDTVAYELTGLVRTMGKGVLFVVDNYDEADLFVHEFFRLLKKVAGNEEHSFVVIALNAKTSATRTVKVQRTLKNCDESPRFGNKDLDFANLTILGPKFKLKELQVYCRTFGYELEELLERAYKNSVIFRRNLDFTFDPLTYERMYASLDPDERRRLHSAIARNLSVFDDSYTLGKFWSGVHWEKAGCLERAVVMYLRFVRCRLDDYAASPTRIQYVLKRVYELLKVMDRLNSYAFQFLLLKYIYQTSHLILEEFLRNWEPEDPLLKILRNFVLEEYDACLGLRCTSDKVSPFKKAWIDFLYNYAHFKKYDRVHDERQLQDTVARLKLKNRKSYELKAEILHLLGTSVAYYDRRRAKGYLGHAEELANAFNITHITVKIANSYSTVYDSELVSLVFLRKAIELTNRMGYYYRTFDARINLLRALLYFGRLKEFEREFRRLKEVVETDDTLDSSVKAYFWRIAGFLGTYLLDYEGAKKCYERSLSIEQRAGFQRASLRGLVLLEVMCGKFDEAKRLIMENREDPALKTRAFEYLTQLVLAESDDEFLRAWRFYKTSEVYLLREEILYSFAERIATLDEQGFLEEVAKWESAYTVERTKLSLFYVLLAKEKYYKFKGNDIRRELTRRQLLRLARSMEITHPEVQVSGSEEGEAHPLLFVLEVFKSLDPKSGPEKIVQLFSNIIYEVFQASRIHVEVVDEKSGIREIFTTTGGLDSERTEIRLHPFTVTIKDSIDEYCRYVVHFCSPVMDYESLEEAENIVWLLEELFSEQIRAAVYRERSSLDSLTGLYNRWKFLDILGEYHRKYLEKGQIFSIFILDIDDFKKINDTMGHAKGDEVLRWLARKLKEFSNGKGFVGRFGGEEFVGILEMDKLSASTLCSDFRRSVEAESQPNLGFHVTISVGVAEVTERQTLTELIGLADQRLYVAKNSGKNSVCANSLV